MDSDQIRPALMNSLNSCFLMYSDSAAKKLDVFGFVDGMFCSVCFMMDVLPYH